ncbi:MAG TPA: hypothetical protein VIN03_19950 [Roseateles sp.]
MSATSGEIRIALFGESDHGKSHYGAQLLSRIETEKCKLKLRTASVDLSAYDDVRKKLNSGLLAEHTPSGMYKDNLWPVIDGKGRSLDLTWPDYAGEQVKQVIDGRTMNQEWLERTQSADGWMLVVRPKLAKLDEDVFSKPLASLGKSKASAGAKPRRSTQARLVELLQMLIHARGLRDRKAPPPLVLLLSCWDELKLPKGTTPSQVIDGHMPLLASYVRCRWGDRASVLGLSALGLELSDKVPNEDFVDNGPENFGFVVKADGEEDSDLTIPLVALADMSGG